MDRERAALQGQPPLRCCAGLEIELLQGVGLDGAPRGDAPAFGFGPDVLEAADDAIR